MIRFQYMDACVGWWTLNKWYNFNYIVFPYELTYFALDAIEYRNAKASLIMILGMSYPS